MDENPAYGCLADNDTNPLLALFRPVDELLLNNARAILQEMLVLQRAVGYYKLTKDVKELQVIKQIIANTAMQDIMATATQAVGKENEIRISDELKKKHETEITKSSRKNLKTTDSVSSLEGEKSSHLSSSSKPKSKVRKTNTKPIPQPLPNVKIERMSNEEVGTYLNKQSEKYAGSSDTDGEMACNNNLKNLKLEKQFDNMPPPLAPPLKRGPKPKKRNLNVIVKSEPRQSSRTKNRKKLSNSSSGSKTEESDTENKGATRSTRLAASTSSAHSSCSRPVSSCTNSLNNSIIMEDMEAPQIDLTSENETDTDTEIASLKMDAQTDESDVPTRSTRTKRRAAAAKENEAVKRTRSSSVDGNVRRVTKVIKRTKRKQTTVLIADSQETSAEDDETPNNQTQSTKNNEVIAQANSPPNPNETYVTAKSSIGSAGESPPLPKAKVINNTPLAKETSPIKTVIISSNSSSKDAQKASAQFKNCTVALNKLQSDSSKENGTDNINLNNVTVTLTKGTILAKGSADSNGNNDSDMLTDDDDAPLVTLLPQCSGANSTPHANGTNAHAVAAGKVANGHKDSGISKIAQPIKNKLKKLNLITCEVKSNVEATVKSAAGQIFNPYEGSPVKKKIEAFEKLKHAGQVTPNIETQQPRLTRTKTKAKEKQMMDNKPDKENTDYNTNLLLTISKSHTSNRLNGTPMSATKGLLGPKTASALKAAKEEAKELQMRRREKELEALKKKEALKQAQAEEIRRKREEKELRVKNIREQQEKEKQAKLEYNLAKEEKMRQQILQDKQDKLNRQKEENEKKRAQVRQKAEEKKRQEEEETAREQRKKEESERFVLKQKLDVMDSTEKLRKVEEQKKKEEELRRHLEAEKQKLLMKHMRPNAQQPRYMREKMPLLPTYDCYDTDDEQAATVAARRAKRPEWSTRDKLEIQKWTCNDIVTQPLKNTFFCIQAKTNLDVRELFGNVNPIKKRTSSAVWSRPPRFTLMNSMLGISTTDSETNLFEDSDD